MSYARNRIDCGVQNNNIQDGFNNAFYARNMELSAKLRSNSTCQGHGGGPTVMCSEYTYGAPRKTIQEMGLVEAHRSHLSSACAPSELNEMVDTFDNPINLTPEQRNALHKGVGMFNYATRSFTDNSSILESQVLGARLLALPSRWGNASRGYNNGIIGVNTPSRMVALSKSNAKYKATKNSSVSSGSYGSYGVS